jgi:hypothetical protein
VSSTQSETSTAIAKLDGVVDEAVKLLELSKRRQREHLRHHLDDLCQSQRLFDNRKVIKQPAKARDHLNRIRKWAVKYRDLPKKAERLNSVVERNCAQSEGAHGLLVWQCGVVLNAETPERLIEDGLAQKHLNAISTDPDALVVLVDRALGSLGAPVKGKRGGNRHQEDWTLRQNILLLGVLFKDLTGDKPGISVDPISRQPTGRFLGFLRLCLGWLGWELTEFALREHFRKVRSEEDW